jgi:dipeptidyl aminopeptidase/acylaminoacyl peptidase
MNATATEAPATTRAMQERDLLDFTWIADPQMSPDGSRIAFTRVTVDREEDRYVTQLWIAETSGGPPRPLTSGTRDSSPRWAPDGRSIAFVRVTDPEKPGQIWLLPMDGGEASARTSLAKGASSPAWSPDGKRIVFSSATHPTLDDPDQKKPKNEPARVVTRPVFRENNAGYIDYERRDHLWVMDASGGAPRPLTHGAYKEESPCFSRDGKHVLFLSDRREEPWFGDEHSAIYAVRGDLAEPTDAPTLVFDSGGAVAAFAEGVDGRFATIASKNAAATRSYNQADLRIAEGAWPMREAKVVNPEARFAVGEDVNSDQHPPRGGGGVPLAWLGDGKAVLARIAREGSSRLARFDLEAETVTELTPPGDLMGGTCSSDGRRWAVVLGGYDTPGELHAFDATTGTLSQLWAPNETVLSGLSLGSTEEFWYDSFDGQRIHAWLVKPPDFDPAKKYPLVLEIHGGPHTAYGQGFFHEFHVLAGAGYLVLYTNPRGSTSYGSEFANIIQYRFPGDDALDLLAGVEAVVKRGIVDEKRIGVTGGSGGGLLTNWLIAHDRRFAAAITQRCVSWWAGMYESADFALYGPFWFRRPPHEDAAEWAERSPMSFVKDIHTPLMIIHSEDDWRTPIAQGEALFRALVHLRRTAVMVRFPGENHELSRSGAPSRRVQNQEHIRAWFDRWLMGKPAPQYGV